MVESHLTKKTLVVTSVPLLERQEVRINIGLGRQLSSGVRVISSEDLISPFGLLKILSLFVCDEDRCLGFLTLSVIKLHRSVILRVSDCHACLLKAMLVHSSNISEFHVGVVAVLGHLVTLGAEVNV